MDPIDLKEIEKRVTTGQYRAFDAFESDMRLLFSNVKVSQRERLAYL